MSNYVQNTYNEDVRASDFDVCLPQDEASNQDLEGINIEENTWDHSSGIVLSRNMHQLWEDEQHCQLVEALVQVARRPPPPLVIELICLVTSQPESEESVVAPHPVTSAKALRTIQKHQQKGRLLPFFDDEEASESTTSNSAQVREPPAQALGNGASGANCPDVIVIDDD